MEHTHTWQWRKYAILSVTMLLTLLSKGQFYDSGQDHFRKLSIIKTAHFNIVFPTEQQKLGQLYANMLEQVYTSGGQTLNWHPRRITASLFTSASYANGEVSWAPRRMNLLTTASPDNYFQDWGQQLALHEFRHVVQSDKLNQSTSKFFNTILGEQFTGLILGLHVPYWFLEGDAVAYETGASQAGRGRTCDFENRLSAQAAQKGIYSYPKAMFGSCRDFVPSRYHLGYQLISYGRLNYGTEIWDNCINRVAKYPIALRPFGKGIRLTSGLKEDEFYRIALAQLTDGPQNAEPDNAELLTHITPKDYTNYHSPQYSNGKIIALREQMSDIPSFVIIDTNRSKPKIVTRPGPMNILHFSAEKDLLVWNQTRQRRWTHANHNQLICYNINSSKRKTLLRHGRYYCSTLAHNADKIASICYTDTSAWSITIHDISGKLISQYNTNDIVPVRVAWSNDDRKLAFIGTSKNHKLISIINLDNNLRTVVIDNIIDDISKLQYQNGYLYFTGNNKGLSALYRFNLSDSTFHIMAESPYGIGSSDITGDTLLFTYYTADGYQIAKKNISEGKAASGPYTRETAFSEILAEQEQKTDFVNDSIYDVKRYSRLAHLINIHSWGPLSVNADNAEIGPGLTIMSQDALSTSFLRAGYQYYYDNKKDNYFIEYTYKGFFPIIGIRGDIDKRQYRLINQQNKTADLNLTEQKVTAFISVPIILKSDVFTTGLTIRTAYQYKRSKINARNIVLLDTALNSLSYTAQLYSHRRQAIRDIQPRLGYTLQANYMHYCESEARNQWAAQGIIYLPGIACNHGISIYGALQARSDSNILFSNIALLPRGYSSEISSKMSVLRTTYTLPVCYPDLCMGNVLYIKRIKANLFYDYAQIKQTNHATRTIQSAGCDLTADFHIYRIAVPFSAGVRYARCTTTNSNFFGLLFSMNFGEM